MLAFRDKLKNIYAENDLYILPVIKYAVALFTFISINQILGYMEPLNNMILVLVLSAFCAIFPWNTIPLIGVIMVILHCFGLGLEVGACAAVLYLILLIFYFRFVPGDGLALTLTTATCGAGFPGIVPIGLGLMRGPVSALTAVCSTISWVFITVVKEVAVPMKFASDSSMLDVVRAVIEGMLNNKMLLVNVVTCAAVVLIVSLIRSSGISWSWEIAIVVGAIAQIGLTLALGNILEQKPDMVSLLAGTGVAALISFILAFFVYNVDYKGAEHYQFEDDEFVYYVKAIPKNRSSVADPAEKAYTEEEEYEE